MKLLLKRIIGAGLFCVIISVQLFAQAELIIQTGHTERIKHLVISEDGKYLVSSAGFDQEIKLWEFSSRKEITTVKSDVSNDEPPIFIYPDALHYVKKNEKSLSKISLSNNKLVWEYTSDLEIDAYAFSKDEKLLAVTDGLIVSIVDIESKSEIKQWETGKTKSYNNVREIFELKFSDDNKYLFARDRDMNIIGWNSSTGDIAFNLPWERKFAVMDMSPDSKLLATADATTEFNLGDKTYPVFIYNINSGSFNKRFDFHTKRVDGVTFSPDGKYLVAYSFDGLISIWDVVSGTRYRTYNSQSPVYSAVFSPDGKFLITSDDLNRIIVWDVPENKYVDLFGGNVVPVFDLTMNKDQTNIYTAGGLRNTDNSIRVWDYKTGAQKNIYNAHMDPVKAITLSDDETFMLTSTHQTATTEDVQKLGFQLYSWDLEKDKVLYAYTNSYKQVDKCGIESNTSSIRLTPDKQRAVSYYTNDLVKVWNIKSAQEISCFIANGMKKTKGASGVAAITTEGDFVFNAPEQEEFQPEQRYLSQWEVATGREVKRFNWGPGRPLGILLSDDEKKLISYTFDELKVWDIASGNVLNSSKKDETLGAEVYDVASDGTYLARGLTKGGIVIWNYETGQIKASIPLDKYSIESATFIENDTRLLIASNKGAVMVYDVEAKKELVKFIGFNDQVSWMNITPENYFQASKGAVNKVHYVDGLNVYNFDQFDLQYNRPDKVLEALGGASQDLISAYKKAWEKRVEKMGFKPSDFETNQSFHVPEISLKTEITAFQETKTPTFSYSISARDGLYNLERLMVEVNGVPLYGVRGKDLPSAKTTEQEITLTLSTGKNIITTSVLNEKGVESLAERFEVTYNPATSVTPNLHIIAIGVSEFEQSEFNLTYADKDANDLIAAIQNTDLGFADVKIHALTNELATKENVLALRNELEQTNVDDQVIVFAATHGLLDDNLDYYLAMHSTDFANPANGGLRYDEIENLIDGIPARNKLMLLDACHSGEVDKEETELGGAIAATNGEVKSRGFRLVRAKKDEGIGLKSSFELMKELFADLRRNNGAAVISSASGQEFAFESSEWQNGVFTYSLLEGLKSGNADLDNNGAVIVSELREYVSGRVQELTNGKQNPTSRAVNLENNFRVW